MESKRCCFCHQTIVDSTLLTKLNQLGPAPNTVDTYNGLRCIQQSENLQIWKIANVLSDYSQTFLRNLPFKSCLFCFFVEKRFS